ncbi:MAG: SDR family oxidoreductase [Burkholderiaceae bacterium]|nr:SDR family oxidoreductase [Burkholderiaceae bacterium]
MNSGKTFLIFGGINGIGGALTEELLSQGHDVYVTASQPDKAGQSPLPSERVLHVDVLDHASVQAAVDTAGQRGLHGMAYCVGTIDLKPLSRTTPDDLMRSFQINTVGAFVAMKSAAPMLTTSKGAVILFSSIAASRGFANHSAIGTAKAALEGLARTLAAELAPNVRINLIAPSLTDTPLAKPFTQNPKMSESIAAMHPLPRLGHAQEMAKAAAFLLSDDAGWMSGQVLHIDGGRSSLEKSR